MRNISALCLITLMSAPVGQTAFAAAAPAASSLGADASFAREVLAARAGYDAYGLPSVLQTLQAMNAQDSGLALMFKTHPAPGARLDQLSEKMQPTLDAYSSQPNLAERFRVEFKPAK